MTADENPKDDDFPVGMRILAVDDDPTCLKLLEGMLRLCKYHVTTSSQAIVALSLLRENKDRFDLVLSDVHMPDMDGFKLLELIGLEMDLPVIMMSVNGETSTVMKGVTHGACDYLLKPIRLEELRNIWQHVLRRRKEGSRNRKRGKENASTPVRGGDGVEGCNENGQTDNNGKLDRKQIKQSSEEDVEEHDVDDEQSSMKKPRVVWSMELHQRFVAAVNHLGIDKAFPKRILDIMNVDKLTRENVASHLQKYRLYLKRMENQHGGMTPLGAIDPSFLPVGSIGSVFRDFHPLSMTEEFSNTRLASLQGARTVGGLNSSRDFAIKAPNSPRMIQLGYMPTLKKPFDDLRKTTLTSLSGHRHGNMLQGLAMFSQLDCLQNKSSLPGFGGSSTLIGDQLSFLPSQFQPTDISSFSNTGISNRRLSSNTFLSVPDDSLTMQLIQPKEHQQQESRGKEIQSAITREPIYGDSWISSGVPDLDICSKSLQNAAQITGYCTALPMVQFQKSDDPATGELNNNNSFIPSLLDSNVLDLSSLSTMTVTSPESVYRRQVISPHATRGDGNRRHLSQGDDDASKFSLSRSAGNGIPQNDTSFTMKKDFDIQNVPHDKSPNILWGSSIWSAFQDHHLAGHSNQYSVQTNDPSLTGKDNFAVAAKSNDGLVKLENDLMNNTAFSGFFDVDVHNCLEDMVNNEVMKRV